MNRYEQILDWLASHWIGAGVILVLGAVAAIPSLRDGVLAILSLRRIFRKRSGPIESARALRTAAIAIRTEIVEGRLRYVSLELERGEEGCRKFLRKIAYQRVSMPELMSGEQPKLSESQLEALHRYRARERELDMYIDYVIGNREKLDMPLRFIIGAYKHRLEKLSEALERLIQALGGEEPGKSTHVALRTGG